MKLEVRCCPKSIRIRFDLDTLKEPEIESGVPDSDCWKLTALILIEREMDTIAEDIKVGLSTGNSWRGTVEETEVIHILIMNEMLDLYCERRELKRLRHLNDEAMSSTNIE